MKTKKVGLAARPVQVDKNDQNKDFADDKFDRKEMSSYNTGNIPQNFMRVLMTMMTMVMMMMKMMTMTNLTKRRCLVIMQPTSAHFSPSIDSRYYRQSPQL